MFTQRPVSYIDKAWYVHFSDVDNRVQSEALIQPRKLHLHSRGTVVPTISDLDMVKMNLP